MEFYRLWSEAVSFKGQDMYGMDKVGEVRSDMK